MATPGRSPNDKEAAAKGNASSPKNLAKKKKDEEWDEDEEEEEEEDEEDDEEEDGDEEEEDEDFEEEDEDLEDEDFDDEDFEDEDFDDEDLDDDDDDDLDDDESEEEEGEDEELKKGGKPKKAAPARATSRAKPPPADPVAAAGAKTSNLYRNVSAAKEEPAKDAKRSRFGAGVAGSSSAAGTSSKRSTAKASGVQPATGRASGRASGRRGEGGPPKRDNFKLVVILVCFLMLLACAGLGIYLVMNRQTSKGPTVIQRNPGKEVKESHSAARTLANKARDAMKDEKLEEALQLYKDAKMALDDCATKIEMLRENPQFSGDEYAGWETIGQAINSDLYLVNDEIFKIENRISHEKRKAQEAANPTPAPEGSGEKTEPPAPAENKTPASGGDEFGPDAERGPTDG